MARFHVDTSSQYLKNDADLGVTTYPLSVSAWFNSDDANLDQGILCLVDLSAADQWLMLLYLNGTTNKLQAYSKQGSTANAASTTTWGANVWNHAMARHASASSRKVNLNNDTTVENTTTLTPSGIDRIAIGALADSSVDAYCSGAIGMCTIWNVELDDAEVTFLALGGDPRKVRPLNIVHHWRLEGFDSPEPDWTSSGASLTLVNSPTRADNPPVEMATPKWAATFPLIEVSGGQSIAPASLAINAGIQAPSLSGSGSVSISPSALGIAVGIQAPALAGSGSVAISPSALAILTAIQAPTLGGTGNVAVSPSALAILTGIQAPSLSNVAGQGISPSALGIAVGIQAPALAGSGSVAISPSALAILTAIQAPTLGGTGSVAVSPSALAILTGIQAPSLNLAAILGYGPLIAKVTNPSEAVAKITNAGENQARVTTNG